MEDVGKIEILFVFATCRAGEQSMNFPTLEIADQGP
jgi:hypothetical protein